MNRRHLLDRAARVAVGLAFLAAAAWGQPLYKIVTPIYTEKPPPSAQGNVQEL